MIAEPIRRNQRDNLNYDRVVKIVGEHPTKNSFGCQFCAEDSPTEEQVPHRALTLSEDNRALLVKQLQMSLIKHHMSDDMIQRRCRQIDSMKRLGYSINDADIQRFPESDKTKKGNLTEICLAEYICSASGADLPVYRLRYNPNVDQSMKGDDVLAFDFSSKCPRIFVGESKFRKTPSKKAVQDIVDGLIISHKASIPTSLHFVADRLYEQGLDELAKKVEDCSIDIIQGSLSPRYVGLLLSTEKCKDSVHKHTQGGLKELIMISIGMEFPENFVKDCFNDIEELMYADSASKS